MRKINKIKLTEKELSYLIFHLACNGTEKQAIKKFLTKLKKKEN